MLAKSHSSHFRAARQRVAYVDKLSSHSPETEDSAGGKALTQWTQRNRLRTGSKFSRHGVHSGRAARAFVPQRSPCYVAGFAYGTTLPPESHAQAAPMYRGATTWHAICAPVYPLTISRVMKSFKASSTILINRRGLAQIADFAVCDFAQRTFQHRALAAPRFPSGIRRA